ncbi:hypothetical protein AAMO2058_000683900 [Amorphochlora amoebiformis]
MSRTTTIYRCDRWVTSGSPDIEHGSTRDGATDLGTTTRMYTCATSRVTRTHSRTAKLLSNSRVLDNGRGSPDRQHASIRDWASYDGRQDGSSRDGAPDGATDLGTSTRMYTCASRLTRHSRAKMPWKIRQNMPAEHLSVLSLPVTNILSGRIPGISANLPANPHIENSKAILGELV